MFDEELLETYSSQLDEILKRWVTKMTELERKASQLTQSETHFMNKS